MAPYRLAVCEDEPAERRQLQALCSRMLSRREIPHTLTAFASAGALAEELERDPAAFDLILLDIRMEGMTGMELAHVLHDRHMPVRVLFVTCCPDYALEGHQVHPVHYLLKPVEPAALDEVLYQDWEAHCGARSVMFRQGSRAVLLPLEEISHIESDNRSVRVHTAGEVHTFSLSLAEAERLVPPGRFCRCHKSYLVNLDQVREVGRASVTLRDGTCLPVGRRYYREFQSTLIRRLNCWS